MYRSAEQALRESIADASQDRLQLAAAEIRRFRPSADDEDGSRQFVNALCDYHPPGDGLTYTAWLDRVEAESDSRRTRGLSSNCSSTRTSG